MLQIGTRIIERKIRKNIIRFKKRFILYICQYLLFLGIQHTQLRPNFILRVPFSV